MNGLILQSARKQSRQPDLASHSNRYNSRPARQRPARQPRPQHERSGLTLLEVLLSVAIFLGSLTAIMQILQIGKRAELMTRLQTEAVMRCETQMAEVLAGVHELTSVSSQPLTDSDAAGTWQWSLDPADSGTAGLLQVTVTVEYVVGEETIAAYALTRYLRDPQLFIDAALGETAS